MEEEKILSAEIDSKSYSIKITPMGEVQSKEDLNIRGRIFKALLKATGLVEIMGRYFDPKRRVDYPRHGLEIWPGYFTALKIRDKK